TPPQRPGATSSTRTSELVAHTPPQRPRAASSPGQEPAEPGWRLLDAQAGDGPADHELLDLLGALEDVEDLRRTARDACKQAVPGGREVPRSTPVGWPR